MKRVFLVVLVLCLLPIYVISESIDLSSFSFDELRILQTRISSELTKRPEWKEIPVPPGFYKIGVDIPAGEWCLKCGKSEYGYVSVRYGKNVNESGTTLSMPWAFGDMIYENGEGTNIEFVNITLSDGYYLEVAYGQVIFTIPERIDFGF